MSTTNKTKNSLNNCARALFIAALALGVSGCDYVGGMFAPKPLEQQREEGQALGAGCRQAGQSLEDCYTRNPNSLKAGIYAGWKEMHEYMAAMNIETAKSGAEPDPIKQILDPKSDKALATAQRSPNDKENMTAAAARAERDAERERRRLERERREMRQRAAE
jgi:hypothetical protein